MATQTALVQSGELLPPMPSQATAPPPKPAERVRSYKDFLTPALHRRFTRSAALLFAACYIESILIQPPSLLWFWNPLSFTGARALLLFSTCLAVFIIRVAGMHVGKKTAVSGAEALYQNLTSLNTAHVFGWYLESAWLFGELYIWSHASTAHLQWVDPGQKYERARLNENPIFLRAFLCCLAFAQTALHLSRAYDRIPLPAKKEAEHDQRASRLPVALQEVVAQLPAIGGRVARLVVPGLAFTIPVYFLLIRGLVWSPFYKVGRILYPDLPEKSNPVGIGIDHIGTFVWQCLSSAAMLAFLWELSNVVFTIYVSQSPLKRGQPLTSEIKDNHGTVVSKSKDPNGSLLSGLKSKKEVPKSFAFWELYLICSEFDSRRKTIYTEVDRKDGSTWSHVSKLCLAEVEAIMHRIKHANEPLEYQQANEAKALELKQKELLLASQKEEPVGMPRIADQKVHDEVVVQQSKNQDIAQNVSNLAKSIGQSPNAQNPLAPAAKRALDWSRHHMVPQEARSRLSRSNISHEANSTLLRFLHTPLGEPFRRTFARTARAVIFGVPHSNKTNIVNAAKALVLLAVASLKEDDYGQVAKSVPAIIRTFTAAIKEINAFMAKLEPSWTDVYFSSSKDRKDAEVSEVVDVFKQGLEDVLLAFAEYASAIGVTKTDLRVAREALGK